MSHDVFISHDSKDKTIADTLCHALENAGIKCWIAPRDIKAGEKWANAITKAIKACRLMLLVYTKESNESSFVYSEVGVAASNNKIIIPFLVDDVRQVPMSDGLELYIKVAHWLDAYPNWRSKFSDLIQVVKHNIRPLDSSPPPSSSPPRSSSTKAEVEITFGGANAWSVGTALFKISLDGEFLGKASAKEGFKFSRAVTLGTHVIVLKRLWTLQELQFEILKSGRYQIELGNKWDNFFIKSIEPKRPKTSFADF